MLHLRSPAESLDYDTPTPAASDKLATEPRFIERSTELIGLLRQRSSADVAGLMDLSQALATLTVKR